MVKKKNNVSIKQQLFIATGAVLLLVAFAFVVLLMDGPYKKLSSSSSSFSGVTVKGQSVCLPHRDMDGPQTMECAQGLKTSDGIYYAIQGVVNRDNDNTVEASGMLVPASGKEKYNITGTIVVK